MRSHPWLASWERAPGPAHVLLSWQPLENTKLSKCWSSAFSFIRCSSKESTSLSLCSITCIILVNISLSSLRSFSSFWLSKEKNKAITTTTKKNHIGPQVRFGPGRDLSLGILDCSGLVLPFNFHRENKEMNWTPGNCPQSHRLQRWVLYAAISSVSILRIHVKWQGRTPLWEKEVNTSQALPSSPTSPPLK